MPASRNPTPQTLYRKLRKAKAALEAKSLIAVDYDRHVAADLEELGVSEEDYWLLLPKLVETALSVGPDNCYAGRHPADRVRKSPSPAFNNLEMWAFKVSLPEFSFPIYFKFCILEHPQTGEPTYCHVDCHPDKPKGK